MGTTWSREFAEGSAYNPGSTTPLQDSAPTFDPLLGFPNGRVARVLNATQEEMEAVQLSPGHKNYCADLAIKAKVCHYESWPFGFKCNHIRHEVEHCMRDDYTLRMKEYERERRLRQRAQRIAASAGAEDEE